MKDFVTQGDISRLKVAYPESDIRMPTAREQRALMLYLRGMTRKAIARALGDEYAEFAASSAPVTWLNSPTAKALIDLFRERELKDIRTSREYLTQLLFESYHKAGSSMEEIAAIREIGKMNGLYKSDEQRSTTVINQSGNIQNVRQLERLSESDLLQIAASLETTLDPLKRVVSTQEKLPPSEEELPR